MKTNQLTTRKLNSDLAPGYHLDGAGLYLQVSRRYGTRSWVFRFSIDRKVQDMGLGGFPAITLSQARRLAAECREQLQRGDNPIELRRQKRDRSRVEALENMPFREAAERFIALHAPTWKNAKHRKQWSSTLEAYAYRTLGSRPVSAIDGAAVTDALKAIWLTKQETASRVKQRIERVCKWAKEGMRLPQQGATKRVKHHAALPVSEVPAFMANLRERDSISARALEVTILTALRTSEVLGAVWNEINLDRKTWTIPAERMKADQEHVVPLSKRVVEILRKLPRVSDFVFPGAKGGPLSNMAMLELLRGMNGNGYTVHGFRSSFRDWAGDSPKNFQHETVEFALAHGIPNKASAAYRRYRAILKRAQVMEDWAAFCQSKPVKATVTKLRRA